MRMGTNVLAGGLLTLLLCGCNTPTPAGTSLLKTTFTETQGGPPAVLAATAPTRHVSQVNVAGGTAEIEVRLDVVEGSTGHYLQGVELVATRSGGGTLSAQVPSGATPVNRGTVENVLASLPLMVEWRQDRPWSNTVRQSTVEIFGDGKVVSH
jgi:hypothetical protein